MHRFYLLLVFLFSAMISFAQSESIRQLAEQLENNSDHGAVIKQAKELLKNRKLITDDRLAIQTVLVHKYQELQQWDTCLNYCQQQVAEAHSQNNVLAEAKFYKLIGNTYYHIPDKDKAIDYWNKCIAISKESGFNDLLEQCYHNIGSVYLERSEHLNQAEDYFKKSIALSIENKTSETALGRLHTRLLATLYERTNRIPEATGIYLDIIKKSRVLKDSSNLAESLMFCSELFRNQKKYPEAIQFSAEALAISRKFNRLDMVRTALDFHSRNLFASGNYKEAYELKDELGQVLEQRYKNDLNAKLAEAEAKFKTAETEHEKSLAIIKARKEKQIYVVAFAGLILLLTAIFYALYQRRNAKQKLAVQQQLQNEKERLSRDLHDNLGSQMALLSNNIENLDTSLRKQKPVEADMEKIKATSKQLLQTLRETIWILNQEHLTAQDFFDKLVDYTHRYLQSYPNRQLNIQEEFSEPYGLNSEQALQLFRICQEAVTNACKYSGSEILFLKGAGTKNGFTVAIIDKGIGYDLDKMYEEEHYGLKNMRQRAASIKAVLKINSSAGKGMEVSVSI